MTNLMLILTTVGLLVRALAMTALLRQSGLGRPLAGAVACVPPCRSQSRPESPAGPLALETGHFDKRSSQSF